MMHFQPNESENTAGENKKMTNNDNGWTPDLEKSAMDALAIAKADWDENIPYFSIGEALKACPDPITPETFRRIANDEMQKVYTSDLTLGEDLKIPYDLSPEKLLADIDLHEEARWVTERNLVLMEKYLKDQIGRQADPKRIRQDLISLNRYLNIYLRSECLDVEDVDEELGDYFNDYLMKQETLVPFSPEFGTLGRFYTWLKDEPAVQSHLNWDEIPTPRICEMLLINLRRNIPFLTRLYEIASDPANDRPESKSAKRRGKRSGRVSGKPKLDREPKQSVAEKRVENWRIDQMVKNRSFLPQIRKILVEGLDWDPDDLQATIDLADTFLVQTLPVSLLTAEQSVYYIETFLRNAYLLIQEHGDPDEMAFFASCFVPMMAALGELGLIPPHAKIQTLDPYYPDVPVAEDLEEGYFREAEDVSWTLDQEPDVYEDHLNWLKWNIDRNGYFLTVFQNDLIASGMDLTRIGEHVKNVQMVMAELLRYLGSTMETLPEGLNEALLENLGDYYFLKNPDELRRNVGSLRRFYRTMVKQGYLSEEAGDECLSYLKKKTRHWMEKMTAADEGILSGDAMDSIWNLV